MADRKWPSWGLNTGRGAYCSATLPRAVLPVLRECGHAWAVPASTATEALSPKHSVPSLTAIVRTISLGHLVGRERLLCLGNHSLLLLHGSGWISALSCLLGYLEPPWATFDCLALEGQMQGYAPPPFYMENRFEGNVRLVNE